MAGGPLRAWGVDLAAKKPVAPRWVVDGAYEMVAFHPGGATVAAAKSDGSLDDALFRRLSEDFGIGWLE